MISGGNFNFFGLILDQLFDFVQNFLRQIYLSYHLLGRIRSWGFIGHIGHQLESSKIGHIVKGNLVYVQFKARLLVQRAKRSVRKSLCFFDSQGTLVTHLLKVLSLAEGHCMRVLVIFVSANFGRIKSVSFAELRGKSKRVLGTAQDSTLVERLKLSAHK